MIFDIMTWTTIWLVSAIYLLWVLFVFAMNVLRAKAAGRLTPIAFILSLPILLCVIALDVVLNYTVLALLTLDFPKLGEWTFSQRLERLIKGTGWRASVADFLADHLLDPFDFTGIHVNR